MRILLVEDDPDLTRQLKLALADAGYAVDHAPDGLVLDRRRRDLRIYLPGRSERGRSRQLDPLEGASHLARWGVTRHPLCS